MLDDSIPAVSVEIAGAVSDGAGPALAIEHPGRAAVIAEAKSWLKTPFHDEARLKGIGVDCGNFQLGVYENLGMIPHVEVPHYSGDFAYHRGEEWFLGLLATYANEFDGPPQGKVPEPGDLIVFKFGRLFAHGAIVVDWPLVIHAEANHQKVCYADATQGRWAFRRDGSARPRRFFSYF